MRADGCIRLPLGKNWPNSPGCHFIAMYCDNQDIVATFCDKFAQVWASCQLSPHLLEKILPEVAIGSKETLIGQTDIFSGIALLGQFDRT